jgi:hypothetical protein
MVLICAEEPAKGKVGSDETDQGLIADKARKSARTRAHHTNDFILVGTTTSKCVLQIVNVPLQRFRVAGVRYCDVGRICFGAHCTWAQHTMCQSSRNMACEHTEESSNAERTEFFCIF